MQFYEIELMTPPQLHVAVSVQTAHYVNKLDDMPRFLEIALILEGRAVYTFTDRDTELVEAGMLAPLFYDMYPCVIRAYHNEYQRHDTVCMSVTYRARRRDTKNVDDYTALKERVLSGSVILIPYHEPLGDRLEAVQRQIQKIIALYVSVHEGDRLRALGEWYVMCGILTDMVMTQLDHTYLHISPSTQRYIQEARSFIATHYREPIGVTDIARHLGISESYLYALFKEVTSIGPMDYVNRIRIEQACTLARNHSLTLNEIATAVGIRYPSYLSRLFKKMVGVTFTDFRKNPDVKVTFYDT